MQRRREAGDYDERRQAGRSPYKRKGGANRGWGRADSPWSAAWGHTAYNGGTDGVGRAGPFGRLAGRLALQKKEVGSVLARSRCPFGPRNDTTPFATWDTAWSRLVGLGPGFPKTLDFGKPTRVYASRRGNFFRGKPKTKPNWRGASCVFDGEMARPPLTSVLSPKGRGGGGNH